jgi:hypothetical protein
MEMEEPVSLEEEEALSFDQALPPLTDPSIQDSPEVLVMTVEIGDGRQDTLTVREHDDPKDLADEFAAKHGLDENLRSSLEQLIRQNRDLVEKRVGSVSPDMASWKDWLKPHSGIDPYLFQEAFSSRGNTPQINSNSRRMMDKRSRMGPVHNRLYALGTAKRNSVTSSVTTDRMTTRSMSQSAFNYGEWLYIRGKKMKETQRRDLEAKIKETEEEQAKGLTFAPAINKYYELLSPRTKDRTEDRLTKKGQDKKAHIERLRSDLTRKELKECSFKPQVNPAASSSELSKCLEVPRYTELFEESKKRQAKLKALEAEREHEFNFSPCIELSSSKFYTQSKAEILDRLLNSKVKFEEKMSRLRNEIEVRESVDSESGQRLFTPSTGRASSGRNSIGKNIFEHLYSLKDHKKQVIERISEKQQQELSESSVRLNDNSHTIFDNFRKKQYERLFRQLDVNGDGLVSSEDLDLTCLDYDVMRVLNPLFVELQVGSLRLNQEQFAVKVEALVNQMTVQDRAVLLKRDSKVKVEENEFKPYISELTELYAQKKRGPQPDSLYNRGLNEKKRTEERLKVEAELKQKEAVKECSFKPATTPYLSRKQQRKAKANS